MGFEKLAKLIANTLNIPPEKVRRERTLKELGADSLDVFQIVIGIEEELQIQVDPVMAEKLRTVGDVADAIEQLTRS